MITSKRPCDIQLDRAKAWNEKIRKRLGDYSKGNVTEDLIILVDMIHDFFCECHHIKEYILNDKSLSISKATINDFIKKNDCLKICADICNGKKHLELKRGGWTGSIPRFHMNVEVEEKENIIYVEFRSKIGDKEFFGLAENCIQKWTGFIKKEITSKK